MPTLTGDRQQISLLPASIEEYVGPDDRVRAYDAFIEYLHQKGEIVFPISSYEGRPPYERLTLLKLLVYSYSYGDRSSRRIERACRHNLSYIWLLGGLRPDYRTIAQFRRDHIALIKDLLKKSVQLCLELDLIDGNVLFIDSTKIRANAANRKTWGKEKYMAWLMEVEKRIDALVESCEATDQNEGSQNSHTQMRKELSKAETLRAKIEEALNQLNSTKSKKINFTDPDCARMHSLQGSHASYNVQQVLDQKNGLIVSTEVVNEGNDTHQLSKQTENANANLKQPYKPGSSDGDSGKIKDAKANLKKGSQTVCTENANANLKQPCKPGSSDTDSSKTKDAKANLEQVSQTVCADAGYANVSELKKVEDKKIQPVVPSKTQALHKDPGPFHHDKFQYDPKKDVYLCPAGKTIPFCGRQKADGSKLYRMVNGQTCRGCEHWGQCTSSMRGRAISRMAHAELKSHFEMIYASPPGQQIYKKRKEICEHPFGYIKRILKVDSFLLRGLQNVNAEASLWATCFNLTRMMTLLGGPLGLMAKLGP
jgi:transposase